MVYMRPVAVAGAAVLLGTLVVLALAGVLRTGSRCVVDAAGRGAGVTGAGIVDTGAGVLDTFVEGRAGAGAGVEARDGAGAAGVVLALADVCAAVGAPAGLVIGAGAGTLAVADPAGHCRP
jgi:hypothetical protein